MDEQEHLAACLPPALRGAAIARIAAGLSGAGVFRVGDTHVLKVARADEAGWADRIAIQQRAGAAGLAPRVVHVDEARRAVVSELVTGRAFLPRYFDPRTRPDAIAQLAELLRRVHALPVRPGMVARSPRALLAELRVTLAGHAPAFVDAAIDDVLAAPVIAGAIALCHNDVNPSNLASDGDRLVLLDWDAAGPNDPLYDLAAVAVFLRMDAATCAQLVAAHDGAALAPLSPAFRAQRLLVATTAGAMFLRLAHERGHAGAGAQTLEETAPLEAIYQRMRAGALDVAAADGQWCFGLALVKAGLANIP